MTDLVVVCVEPVVVANEERVVPGGRHVVDHGVGKLLVDDTDGEVTSFVLWLSLAE